MARHRHRHDSLDHLVQRDAPSIANRRLLDRNSSARQLVRPANRATEHRSRSEPEDRRRYHPLGPDKPARTKLGGVARIATLGALTHRKPEVSKANQLLRDQRFSASRFSAVAVGEAPSRSNKSNLPSRVQFQSAKHVWICVKRKTRKEVMHALKKTGYGRKKRQPRRNMYSDVAC